MFCYISTYHPTAKKYMNSIWTAWADYGATGEGRTCLVWIGYALDAAEARELFSVRFGEFFTRFCVIEAGAVLNHVTELLLPPATAERLESAKGKAQFAFYAHLHLNYA
jgi:hypothetical protein